jgi:succinate dehydrogenase / fumarate reductase membrane anchor subunit
MSSRQTPLHRVQGMGASHSGTGHFWRQRVSAAVLVPLGLWFGFTVLGLAGRGEVVAVGYLAHPWNAILMGGFVTAMVYHMSLGLRVVIDDYVHAPGMKIFLLVLNFAIPAGIWVVSLFSIIRIAAL